MRKISTMKNRTPKSVTRGRVAVVTGGLVAAIALGSTAAMAAAPAQHDATASASSVTQAVQKQAADQKAAAVKKAADAKAAAEAKKANEAKKAADAKARVNGWVTPAEHYVLGAGYAQAGPHWIHKHSGQDFVVPSGTTVRAAHTGTVVTAGWGGAYGNNIVIKHGSQLYTQYGHLSKIEVHVGEPVTTGEEIGKSGSTGNSTGPHLHFEVRTTPYYGSSVEPLHFLRAHGVNP
ncbi:M23 family metallopeptidase [Actinacidiphila rubida]|uniref:Peptidase family M23 n=1 Tax=Actinacidiphila rubida TaxID=310780 RepID=A0A1H8SH51_9ACTN|nr:M23 family metallopeptidase [Actinacidiphila rubida]SEO77895.1 Peptidase family M23 [Actinacidiphila rubida]